MMTDNRPLSMCSERRMGREVLVSGADTRGFVLVVEDDDGISDVISMILADAGFDSAWVRSGEAALLLARDRQPGLILLDLSVAGAHLEGLIAQYRRTPNGTARIVAM